jgi:hypothetical protein
MSAEEAIKAALGGLGLPVERLIYKGKAQTFITYQFVMLSDVAFCDDENEAVESIYRVDIFSRSDYTALLQTTKQALKLAGFYGIEVEAELYESDSGFFHVPITVRYLEEVEGGTPK